MSNILFLIVLLWCLRQDVTNAASTTKCPEGTYLHQQDDTSYCLECPHGTFMPWTDHKAEQCFDCTKAEDPNIEVLIGLCDRFHDADVQCVEGYYRRLARNSREKPTCLTCRPACPEHHYPVHPCQNFSDLGCCAGENYDYYIGEGGVRMCRERPWMCRRGQYLDDRLNDCRPCPKNTFMPEDYHSYTKCWDCLYLSDADLPLHTVITQPCTSTQSPRYGCKTGFYVNHELSYRGDNIGCSPCQTCGEGKYVGQQCDMYNDTVCCDKPNMTVVDGPQGALCVEKIDAGNIEISTSDEPYAGGKVSIMNETTGKKIKDSEDATDDDDCEDGMKLLFLVLFAISFLINALMVIKCMLWPQRKYLTSKAKKLVTKLKACTSPFADHLNGSKSDSRVIAVQESDIHAEEEMLQNDENEGLVQQRERKVLIALVGKTGNGKSATGNTILGNNEFICSDSISSVTRRTAFGNSEFRGTTFKVVDIPDVEEGRNEIKKLKDQLITLFHENPEDIVAVTVVIKYGGRFTKDDIIMLEMLRSTFGNHFIKHHVVVIMTFGDMFKNNKREQTFQEWCAEQVGPFADLINECQQRVMLFDNTLREGREEHVQDLIEKTKNIADQGPQIRRRFPTKGRGIRSHETKAVVIQRKNVDCTGAIAGIGSEKRETTLRMEDLHVKCKYQEQDESGIQPEKGPGVSKTAERQHSQPENKPLYHGSTTMLQTDV